MHEFPLLALTSVVQHLHLLLEFMVGNAPPLQRSVLWEKVAGQRLALERIPWK